MRLGWLFVVACSKSAPTPTPPAPVDTVPVAEPVRTSVATLPGESTLTPDAVLATISSTYLTGIKRCYKERLKVDATARGTVTLAFTVDDAGKTESPTASGFEKSVDDCITSQMPSWVFAIPKDKDGEPTDASFKITLKLVPE